MSVWQHIKLSEQIRPWALACCWDVKQASNQPTNQPTKQPTNRTSPPCLFSYCPYTGAAEARNVLPHMYFQCAYTLDTGHISPLYCTATCLCSILSHYFHQLHVALVWFCCTKIWTRIIAGLLAHNDIMLMIMITQMAKAWSCFFQKHTDNHML